LIFDAICKIIGTAPIPEPETLSLFKDDFLDFDCHWVKTEVSITDIHYPGQHIFAAGHSENKKLWLLLPPHSRKNSSIPFLEAISVSLKHSGSISVRKGQCMVPFFMFPQGIRSRSSNKQIPYQKQIR
jgi:hypothetical protein